jgi:hypothetical protein
MEHKLYPNHDPSKLEPHYCAHVSGMTEWGLDLKSDIAIQLAWRDKRIAELEELRRRVEKLQVSYARRAEENQGAGPGALTASEVCAGVARRLAAVLNGEPY